MKIVKGLHKSGEKSINYNGFKANFPILEVDSFPIFSDENDKLWSEHINEFESTTLKILVDSTGMIRSFSYDVTAIGIPTDETVDIVEIDSSAIPENFFEPVLFTNWSWDSENGICERVPDSDEQLILNTEIKNNMQKAIIEEITKLQILEKHGVSTKSDKKRLETIEKALIELHNINPEDEKINWPKI